MLYSNETLALSCELSLKTDMARQCGKWADKVST